MAKEYKYCVKAGGFVGNDYFCDNCGGCYNKETKENNNG